MLASNRFIFLGILKKVPQKLGRPLVTALLEHTIGKLAAVGHWEKKRDKGQQKN